MPRCATCGIAVAARFASSIDGRSGERLIRVARRARTLGFLAIEARGCARSPHAVRAAQRACAAQRDPAIGWQFDQIAPERALTDEDLGADLVLVSARTLSQIDAPGAHTLAHDLMDVTDDTVVVTTPWHEQAHAAEILSAASHAPFRRGAARRSVLVVTDRENDNAH